MNIIINNICNQQCKYCFANKIIDSDKKNMTIDNFEKCLDFLKNSNDRCVKLIGGEPTLHPNFNDFINIAINNNFKEIVIFTNGTFSRSVGEQLIASSKLAQISLVVNYNSYEDAGEINFNKTTENIKILSKTNINITLGINLYNKNQDIDFFINLANSCKIKSIRYSFTVPNTDNKAHEDLKKYFKSLLPLLITICKKISENHRVNYAPDCNNIPICLLSDKDIRELAMIDPVLLSRSNCIPVLDVQPNLNIMRCFILPEGQRSMLDFNNEIEATEYFVTEVDKKYLGIPLFSEECEKCWIYKTTKRSCGCLKFKEIIKNDKGEK